MLMTDETFLASVLFSIVLIRMFQKSGAHRVDQQPSPPLYRPAVPQRQTSPLDQAA